MNATQFWILNSLSVLVALLIGFEIYSDYQLDQATALQQNAQAPIAEAQQLRPVLVAILQRLVKDAPHDAALKDILVKYGMKMPDHVEDAPPVLAPAPSSTPTPATPSAP